MSVYYNENDPRAAAWLKELILRGLIPSGVIDTRSIEDVKPYEVAEFAQCHFFAGIGGWALALKLAGVADHQKVWTGSCPCQPFSNAGRRKGIADKRHLWPAWRWLIDECGPERVFGEQVSSPAGRQWLAVVRAELEASGYAVGAAALNAASVGAPHIRQRIYWVGYAGGARGRWHPRTILETQGTSTPGWEEAGPLADVSVASGADFGVGDSHSAGPQGRREQGDGASERAAGPAGVGSHWQEREWAWCKDPDGRELWRPIEPGTLPLADGFPERVGLIRGYGNAIVPQLAAEFIKASGVI